LSKGIKLRREVGSCVRKREAVDEAYQRNGREVGHEEGQHLNQQFNTNRCRPKKGTYYLAAVGEYRRKV